MILVVDDDEGVRATYEHWLKSAGLAVQSVSDGRAALEVLRTVSGATVLLDIYMPGMEGIETLRYMKKHHPESRIIVMSGMRNSKCDMFKAALAFGADAVLEKPFPLSHLLSVLGPQPHADSVGRD